MAVMQCLLGQDIPPRGQAGREGRCRERESSGRRGSCDGQQHICAQDGHGVHVPSTVACQDSGEAGRGLHTQQIPPPAWTPSCGCQSCYPSQGTQNDQCPRPATHLPPLLRRSLFLRSCWLKVVPLGDTGLQYKMKQQNTPETQAKVLNAVFSILLLYNCFPFYFTHVHNNRRKTQSEYPTLSSRVLGPKEYGVKGHLASDCFISDGHIVIACVSFAGSHVACMCNVQMTEFRSEAFPHLQKVPFLCTEDIKGLSFEMHIKLLLVVSYH